MDIPIPRIRIPNCPNIHECMRVHVMIEEPYFNCMPTQCHLKCFWFNVIVNSHAFRHQWDSIPAIVQSLVESATILVGCWTALNQQHYEYQASVINIQKHNLKDIYIYIYETFHSSKILWTPGIDPDIMSMVSKALNYSTNWATCEHSFSLKYCI